jgi:hypothetical protein
MRKHNGGGFSRTFGLVLSRPTHFADGERRYRHAANRLGPNGCTKFVDQVLRVARRTHVIPQQCRTNDIAIIIEQNHSMLLPRNGYRRYVIQPTGATDRFAQSLLPCERINFRPVRMRSTPMPNQVTGVGVTDDDFARLSR